MTLDALSLLYLALAVMIVSITIPLSMILWRAYFMMDHVQSILLFARRMVKYGEELEKIPMSIIERFMK